MYRGKKLSGYSEDELYQLSRNETDRVIKKLLLMEIASRMDDPKPELKSFVHDRTVAIVHRPTGAEFSTVDIYFFDHDDMCDESDIRAWCSRNNLALPRVEMDPYTGHWFASFNISDTQSPAHRWCVDRIKEFDPVAATLRGIVATTLKMSSVDRNYNYRALQALTEGTSDLDSQLLRIQVYDELVESYKLSKFSLDLRDASTKSWDHTFTSVRTKSKIIFKDRVHTLYLQETYLLTPETKSAFASWIRTNMLDNMPKDYKPYMITYTKLYSSDADDGSNNVYKNASPKNIEESLDDILENYVSGSFGIDEVSIHYTGGTVDPSELDFTGGFGEGLSEPYLANGRATGYWFLDVGKTRTMCILNAFVAWLYYKDGDSIMSLYDNVSDGAKPLKRLDHIKRQHRSSVGATPSSRDMHKIYNHEHLNYPADFSFETLDPEVTRAKCVYVTDKNHTRLLVHETFLDKATIKDLIQQLGSNTYLDLIRTHIAKKDRVGINTADIESYREQSVLDPLVHYQVPIMIGVEIEDNYAVYKGRDCLSKFMDDIVAYTTATEEDLTIWFHNGGRYDHHILFDTLTKYSDPSSPEPMEILDLNGSLVSVTTSLANGFKLILKDSCKIIPIALAEFKKSFKLDVGKMPDVDTPNITLDRWLNDPLMEEYLRLDVAVLKTGLERYQDMAIDIYDINPLNYVSCSSVMKALFYSTYYSQKQYPLYSINEKAHKFIERGFGGGITEAYKLGIYSNICYYDYSSLYPWAGTNPLPYGKPKWIETVDNRSKRAQLEFLTNFPGTYEVIIRTTPKDKLPYLHVHTDRGYIGAWFHGYSGVVVNSHELIYMLGLGYQVTIIKGIAYNIAPHMAKFFTDLYVHKAKATAEGNIGLKTVTKANLNNSYGFMGFRKYDRSMIKVFGIDTTEEMLSCQYNSRYQVSEHDRVYIAYGNGNAEVSDVCLPVASWITGYARMRYHQLVTSLQKVGVTVYYGDTDSVFVDRDLSTIPSIVKEFIGAGNGSGLGELKKEYDDCYITEAVFVGLKVYGLTTINKTTHETIYVNKVKGISMKGVTAINDADVSKSAAKDGIIYQVLKEMWLTKIPTSFTFNMILKGRTAKIRGHMTIKDKMLTKTLDVKYRKGVVQEDGTVTPLYIPTNIRK